MNTSRQHGAIRNSFATVFPALTRFAFGSALIALAATAAQAAGEIRLIKASSNLLIDSGAVLPAPGEMDTVSEQKAYFRVRLRNIAFEKQVRVIVRASDSVWDTLPANWIRQADDDYEDWELKTSFTEKFGLARPVRDLEFKLGYYVDSTWHWDDNGGMNYRLPRNGGTLLGPGTEVLLRSARWEMDTGAFSDSTVLTGEAEVRGFNANSGFRVSYSLDRMKTQGLAPILEAPVPSWSDSTGLADSNKVYVYRFSLKGIKIQSERNDFIHFHVTFWRDGKEFKDNNQGNRYVVGLGWALSGLDEVELPKPVSLPRPDRVGALRVTRGAGMKPVGTPAFPWEGRGLVDGLGRAR